MINYQLTTKAQDSNNKFDINLSNNSSASDKDKSTKIKYLKDATVNTKDEAGKSNGKMVPSLEATRPQTQSFKVASMTKEKSTRSSGIGKMVGLIKKHTPTEAARLSKEQIESSPNIFLPWVEMKFEQATPACRSYHACAASNGSFYIYGGVYGGLD